MSRRRLSIENRPFECLGKILADNNIRLPEVCLPEPPVRRPTPREERRLFRQAMADVSPLCSKRIDPTVRARPTPAEPLCEDPDAEAIRQLRRLVETGDGFVLRHTAEYLEGSTEPMPPEASWETMRYREIFWLIILLSNVGGVGETGPGNTNRG